MSQKLKNYKQKRAFTRTPEPRGKIKRSRGKLRFVVQKHQASHLHYDFRLELDGALKSWAVPKGPSLNPADKRLAMMVEDHPLDYRTLEGIIPPGNYGAGTVMIWDEGVYRAVGEKNPSKTEALMREGLKKGALKFILEGQKLRGEFALVKIKGKEENAWLLLKKDDQYSQLADIRESRNSAKTGRTMEEIASSSESREKKVLDLKGIPKAPMPQDVRPMLATLAENPPAGSGWLFEVKWDGYRAIAEVSAEKIRLYSRNLQPFNSKYAPIVEALREVGHETVLDGEVVVVDGKGRAKFQLLQNYHRTHQGNIQYCIFDILYADGRDLRGLPLVRRKKILRRLIPEAHPRLKYSEHIEEKGKDFFAAASAEGLEGIMAKRADSPYREGQRTREWFKIRTQLRQEAVIAGFTEPRKGRKHLGALILGVYGKNGELMYIGHTGGGFDAKGLKEMFEKLEPYERAVPPFRVVPKTNAPPHWVEPKFVCEVEFREWTEDGHMRQPIFLGLREDKSPNEVRQEAAQTESPRIFSPEPPSKGRDKIISIGGHELKLTNLGKLYWPEEGYTKGDLIEYYRRIAPILLPYLKDRPESLHRHPDGIEGESFFQKNVEGETPEWVKTVKIFSESENKEITYLVCQDEAALAYMANLGCIELNPWNSRYQSMENPDYLILDLDPEDIPFEKVIETAQAVRAVCEELDAPAFVKTSGARGLHVNIPLGAKYSYEHSKQLAELLAHIVHQRIPDITSVERSPSRRQGKVYVDFLQNRKGQTLAAPYSVRPKPCAPVSTPLEWKEVKKGLDPTRFTIKTIFKRLDAKGDVWKPVLGRGIRMEKILGKIDRLNS